VTDASSRGVRDSHRKLILFVTPAPGTVCDIQQVLKNPFKINDTDGKENYLRANQYGWSFKQSIIIQNKSEALFFLFVSLRENTVTQRELLLCLSALMTKL
jgi:hypothetical protein